MNQIILLCQISHRLWEIEWCTLRSIKCLIHESDSNHTWAAWNRLESTPLSARIECARDTIKKTGKIIKMPNSSGVKQSFMIYIKFLMQIKAQEKRITEICWSFIHRIAWQKSCRNNKICGKKTTRWKERDAVSRFNIHTKWQSVRRVQFSVQFVLRTFSCFRHGVFFTLVFVSCLIHEKIKIIFTFRCLSVEPIWSVCLPRIYLSALTCVAMKSIPISYCRSSKGTIKSKLMTFYANNKGKHFNSIRTILLDFLHPEPDVLQTF